MSNKFPAPSIKKMSDAVTEQVKLEEGLDDSIKVPSSKGITDPAQIFMNGIDTFADFIKGKVYNGSLAEKQKYQLSFMDSLNDMLSLSDAQLKTVLDHFLITIAKDRRAFEFNNIVAPLFTVEKMRPAEDVARYKRFVLFITLLSEHAGNRQRFIDQFDVVKFVNMYNPVIKQRLTNYIYR